MAVGAAIVGSSLIGAKKAGDAADTAAAGYDRATEAQLEMFYEGQKATAPWRETGQQALTQLEAIYGLSGDKKRQKAIEAFEASPGYAFQMDEMMKAAKAAGAATGTYGSGGYGKSLVEYAGNLASTEFGKYTQGLMNLSQQGMGMAGQTAATSANVGSNIGQNMIGAGQAAAAGQINQANMMTGAVNQGMLAYGLGMFDRPDAGVDTVNPSATPPTAPAPSQPIPAYPPSGSAPILEVA